MTKDSPSTLAVWPPAGAPVSIASWLREMAAMAWTFAVPPPFPEGAARGQGEPVIVIPGFCSPNLSTAHLRRFLNRQGFAAQAWCGGVNLGPVPATMRAFERQIAGTAAAGGRKVTLIGISMGGILAREMAKHCPDLIASVITLVSPINLPVTTPLAPLVHLAQRRWPDEFAQRFTGVAEPPPVRVTAIVNPRDGVVDWRNCVPPPAPQVETVMIEGFHMTIASNPEAQRVVAARLAAPV